MSESLQKRGKTFEQRFVDELRRQCGGSDVAISNKVLRDSLGWQPERFDTTRNALIEKKIIKPSPGHGGKTKFYSPDLITEKSSKKRAFISYSHKDREFKDEFINHIRPLEKLGKIQIWHDKEIPVGSNIFNEIISQMEKSDIVFFLISSDFIASDFCYNIEMKNALNRMSEHNILLIPIILRSCLWKKTPLGALKSLPEDGKAISSFDDRDFAYAQIATTLFDELSVE